MHYFFRPKSKLVVPLWLARLMNTLNLLAPVLLLMAVAVGFSARLGGLDDVQQQWLLRASLILALVALVIRVGWGVTVRILYRRYATR